MITRISSSKTKKRIKEKGRWGWKKSENFQVNSISSPYSAAVNVVAGDVLLLWP